MATTAAAVSQTHTGRSSSSFSEQNRPAKDCSGETRSRERGVSLEDLAHRLPLEAEAKAQDADNAYAASARRYFHLSFQERTLRLQDLAHRLARRRKFHDRHEQRRAKREADQKRKEKRWRHRRRRLLEKNDEIMEWRDTFEVRQVPPGIEKQFWRSGKVPARHENWWLVPARTSKTMLERA